MEETQRRFRLRVLLFAQLVLSSVYRGTPGGSGPPPPGLGQSETPNWHQKLPPSQERRRTAAAATPAARAGAGGGGDAASRATVNCTAASIGQQQQQQLGSRQTALA
eukprot:GHVU01209618.1.p7 GENE.GHVU01209618.1~~GHVU01209618.1.p7  ORF type:complete len:107 (+),score=25.58 GHVU01209618.1:1201-1521(+)